MQENRRLTTLAVRICDQQTHACCLFHAQVMVTGVLPSVNQPCERAYLWHHDQVTMHMMLSVDIFV